jgi:hypothetical protein
MTTVAAHAHAESFLRSYVFSTDHKTIAKQYLATGIFMGIVGGLLSYVIRMQLADPGQPIPGYGVIGPQQYNALVTMHGTIMIFWVAMPILLAALANFLIPLMIGAKDMAFPRLNMLSYWVFLLSTVVLLVSFFVPGGAAAGGWTSYPPLSGTAAYSGGQCPRIRRLPDGRDQLHHHRHQPARAGNAALRHAAHGLDAGRRVDHLPVLGRPVDRGRAAAAPRSRGGYGLLRSGGRG